MPLLTGKGFDKDRVLYWEFYEFGFQQAVRWGRWKGLALELGQPIALYDLQADIGEQHNVAAVHPEIVAAMASMMKAAHVPSPNWPLGRE